MARTSDEDLDAAEMSFGDHLEELRSRLIRCVLATFVAFVAVFVFHDEILRFVTQPYVDVMRDLHMPAHLYNVKPAEAFFVAVKVSVVAALLVVAPVWIWQMWSFVSVGLYRNERAWVFRFAPLMILLFGAGVAFGYTTLIPIGLDYLLSFRDPTVLQNLIQVSEYLSFFTTLTLVLGLTFELPIVLALLTRLEIVSIEGLRSKRKHFILGAFIVAAVLTPPDVVTQVLMAIPLLFLYELGIGLSWLALGENRPPIAWRRWRRRGAVVLVVLLAAFLLQDRAVEGYRARLAGQKIRRAADPVSADAVPYLEMLASPRLTDTPPDAAVLVRDDGDDELWVATDATSGGFFRVRFSDDRLTPVGGDTPDEARFLLQTAAKQVRIERVAEVRLAEWVPVMLDLADAADDDDRAVILHALAGLERGGVVPMGEVGGDDVLSRWRARLAAAPDAAWTARP